MLLDIHCHLTDKLLYEDVSSIIQSCESYNLGVIITAGLNPIDNRKVLELSEKYGIIKPSLGIYPLDSLTMREDEIEEEIEFIHSNNHKIIAISEVGLDLHYSTDLKVQKIVFQKFIELSEKTGKPLIIHSRKAEIETIEMLESSNARFPILHSFTGNSKLIKRCIDNKFFFSIPPIIVRSTSFQNLASLVPLNQLLTETDSPYQSPLKDQHNSPLNVIESIKKISQIKEISLLETENIIFMNFQKIFKKWKTI